MLLRIQEPQGTLEKFLSTLKLQDVVIQMLKDVKTIVFSIIQDLEQQDGTYPPETTVFDMNAIATL